ncbi:MAG TPA: hypothetical protein VLH77_06335 [Gammaproteobacteria bacterium]|nr:hypothetical protein [Gammaproteobacteria bacterium]
MSAMEPLYRLVGITPSGLTEEQSLLLEAEIFARICEELKDSFRKQYREYFLLMKLTTEMENKMLESKFARLIIQDILATGEYNLEGIAHYADSHEEVIEEVLIGRIASPSAVLLRKLIDLHHSVRQELYEEITRKVNANYLTAA